MFADYCYSAIYVCMCVPAACMYVTHPQSELAVEVVAQLGGHFGRTGVDSGHHSTVERKQIQSRIQ